MRLQGRTSVNVEGTHRLISFEVVGLQDSSQPRLSSPALSGGMQAAGGDLRPGPWRAELQVICFVEPFGALIYSIRESMQENSSTNCGNALAPAC